MKQPAPALSRHRRQVLTAGLIAVGVVVALLVVATPPRAGDSLVAPVTANSVLAVPASVTATTRLLAVDEPTATTAVDQQALSPQGTTPAHSGAVAVTGPALPPLSRASHPATPDDLRTNKAAWNHTGKLFGMIAHAWPTNADAWNQARADLGGLRPSSQMWFVRLDGRIDIDALRSSHDAGALPIVTIEPRDQTSSGPVDSRFTLAKVAAGEFDTQLGAMAADIRDSGVVVGVRFAHEMNGDWFPWGMDTNGNEPGDLIAAWRHVHELFDTAGVAKAIWIWAPNINVGRLAELYPGDAYVDWMGLSGYFLNFDPDANAPLSPDYVDLFDEDLATLATISSRPILIAETGADGEGGQKERFITDLFEKAAVDNRVIGFVWYNKPYPAWGADLRFNATAEALDAFRQGLSSGVWAYDLTYR